MPFMQPQVYSCDYWQLDTNNGTTILPADVCGTLGLSLGDSIEFGSPHINPFRDYVEGGCVDSALLCNGFIGRMSAPGYMDCTDWGAYETEQEAIDDLKEMYGDDEETDEETDEE